MSGTSSSEQQLLEYKAILDNAGVAILFTRNRLTYRSNPLAEKLFAWPAGALIGQPGHVFFPDAAAYQALIERARPVLARGEFLDMEVQMARHDGSTFFAQLFAGALDAATPHSGTVWIIRDISREVSARTTHERLMREQQMIFDRAQIGIVYLRERVIQRCNPSFERMFGYPAGQLVGQSTRVCFASEAAWQAAGERVHTEIAASGTFNGEFEYQRHDGTAIWCHVTGNLINPANPDEGYVWLYEDITAQRAAEQALVASHREYSLIFDNAAIGISYMRDRVFLRCNRRLEEIFGFQPGGLIGQSSRLLFANDQEWQETGDRVYGATQQGGDFSGDVRYQRQDGTAIWVKATGRLIKNGAEQVWIWTHQDDTSRYLAEEALRKSHMELEQRVHERTAELSQQLHFLQQLIEAIPGPVFYKDAQSRYLGCNRAFAEFIGSAAIDLIGKGPHDLAPPELAARYLAADQALFTQPGAQIYESPVRHADGGMHHVVFHKATFTQPDGSVGGLVGFMLDITEHKRMLERLQQAATVFDSSAEGVVITAPDQTIIAVNRAFTEITGYSEEEAIGRSPSLLQSGRQSDDFYREMWEAIHQHGQWQGEVWNKCKNGRIYPEWLTISTVKDAANEVTHYVGVFSDITAIKSAYEKLNHLAHHDPLTGLPNRLLLEDRLHLAIQRARREQTHLAVLFLDLDRFKTINDSLGHHVGDLVLCEVSSRLSHLMRESDTVARFGGDEFLVLMEGISGPSAAAHIADKILQNLSEAPVSVEQDFFVGASIGISLFPQDGNDPETLIKHADVAMYRAKERGRNTHEFFAPELAQSSPERFRLDTDLRRAIERDELRLYLQPQFSLQTGQLVGAEALVRWQHPERGLVMPGEFIATAEESGLIVPIGEWVQRTACQCWADWHTRGLQPGILAINVSGVEFRRGRIQESIRKMLEATRMPPSLLELEITESAIMGQAENSIQALHGLRAMGVSLAIDDFGTGYSSLAYLKRLPLNKLKVDQSFVRGLPDDSDDCAIARAVIALGHSLQLTIIAEGVETLAQSEFLRREGCDEMQGYLRARPMPMDTFRQQFLQG